MKGGGRGDYSAALPSIRLDAEFFQHGTVHFHAQAGTGRDLDPSTDLLDRPGDQVLAEGMRGTVVLENRFLGEQ